MASKTQPSYCVYLPLFLFLIAMSVHLRLLWILYYSLYDKTHLWKLHFYLTLRYMYSYRNKLECMYCGLCYQAMRHYFLHFAIDRGTYSQNRNIGPLCLHPSFINAYSYCICTQLSNNLPIWSPFGWCNTLYCVRHFSYHAFLFFPFPELLQSASSERIALPRKTIHILRVN